jgi:hypothetical protein
MAQMIACQNVNGVVLASDGKVIDFDQDGRMRQVEVDSLVQLGEHAAILAGGAPEAVEMCSNLRGFIADEGITDVQDLYAAALAYLGSEYESFMRKKCEALPVDPIHHVYFILGGRTLKDDQHPFRLYMLWTKKKLPRLDGDEIGRAYTVPRRMALEYKLSQLCREGAPLEQLHQTVKQSMETLGKEQEEVGPPYSFALISGEGLRKGD